MREKFQLGLHQISMTSKYAHVLPPVMTDAAERLGQALWASHELNCNLVATHLAGRRGGV
jgi:hypothetical protein